MTKKELLNLEVKYQEVTANLDLARKLLTHEGFYRFWFSQLGKPENKGLKNYEVFDKVNDLYRQVFQTDKGKYTSYNSFLTTVKYYRKK